MLKMLVTKGDWELQHERMPKLINYARVIIVSALLVLQFTARTGGHSDEEVYDLLGSAEFYGWIALYIGIITLTWLKPDWQRQTHDLPNATAVVDISMMMVLTYLAGGISSGLGILVLPFVATSCLLSYGRYPLLYASYTALLIVLTLFANHQVELWVEVKDTHLVVSAMLLIAACYLVALLTAFSASYMYAAGQSASRHKLAYRRITGLNQLVLNQVQEAVVVIDSTQKVWLFNRKAKTYFPGMAVDKTEDVFGDLVSRWAYAPSKTFETDIHIFQHAMHVRAIPLIQEETQLLMLFIRSLREVAAEAMATKLASLGQLTANLAHEIRNPMSAIRHANDLLLEELNGGENTDPAKCKLHAIIDANIERIDKMLEDVSLINKRDSLSKEPVNLMKFWLDFKQEFILNNPEALGCVKMNMEGRNLSVFADPMHLQQIMWNLCNNAWHHSRKNENAITALIRPSGRLHISIVVADNGAGVPAHLRARLFEPFFTTEKQGTGLGLYVARELAHANLGQLHYHPEMNGFELILPKDQHD